jgi:ribosome-binding factor A
VNQILREVISDALVRLSDLDDRLGFLTVTEVTTSPDMRHAQVYLDTMSDDVRNALDELRVQIQAMVNSQTHMKRTPKLSFLADPVIHSAESIDEILRRSQHDDD